ncbi:ATP-dependent (S)-NAD(P)H-hydrate dehydratase [Planctomycetes bacterium Pla163]|uniref:ADP-dependent (S)-NAD(P)H-hydrate dehydratase n=1 Tax=Rohdeia mirabilis TaxID=2528008 RepID=A0A518CWS7_9BACT|nr:ATP-dependent (S)-NAD(P)H-hydrate dehydratase [Planctomycetes bacterium Pla163]
MSDSDRPRPLPSLAVASHKGDAGRVTLLAGSAGDGGRAMPGSAVLATRAALRGGAGLVSTITLDDRVWAAIAAAAPEALPVDVEGGAGTVERVAYELERRADDRARAVGPGLGRGQVVRPLVEAFLHGGDGPLVVDADGLNAFAGRPQDLRRGRGALVITPHPGEAARLLDARVGDSEDARIDAARRLADSTCSVCVLKGHRTVVVDGDGVWINSTGNPGLASGGTGDVLTGLLTAFLAQVGEAFSVGDAVRAAVWVHGRAADLAVESTGVRALLASDVVDRLGAAERELDAGRGA